MPAGRKKPLHRAWVELPKEKQHIDATFPPIFEPFLTQAARWKICFGGRGGGKSESIAKALLLMGQQRPLRILCCRETMSSIKQSSHQVLATMIGILGLEHFYTIERDRIYGPWVDVKDAETGQPKRRRTDFFFIGLRDQNVGAVKSYHDINVAWVEEASQITRRSLRLLEPTIRRAQGSDPDAPSEIWLSFNPEHTYDPVYQLVQNPPEDSIIIEMSYRTNPWFEESGLRKSMEEMKRRNYEEYLHVWEGHCLKFWEGQVLLNELKAAEAEGRICEVPYRSDAECHVTFDIGGGHDATALWVWQPIGDHIHFIAYHERVQSNLDYFLKWLENQPFVITKYFLPHDARQRHAGMSQSYESLVRARGKKVQIVPGGKGSVHEGINAMRTLFPRMKFDAERCARGLECLRNYRFEVEMDGSGGLSSAPVHDVFSHGADSMRYTCVAYRINKELKSEPGRYFNAAPFRGDSNAWMAL